MKKRLVSALLSIMSILMLALPAWGANPGAPPVLEVLSLARDPSLSRSVQMQIAQYTLDYLRSEASRLSLSPPEKLAESYLKNPELLKKLNLEDTEGLAEIVSEFSALIRQLSASGAFSKCEDRRGLAPELMEGMASYRPCRENSWNYQSVRWRYKDPQGKVTRTADLPGFLYTENLATLVETAGISSYYLDEVVDSKNPFVPPLEKIRKANPNLSKVEDLHKIMAASDFLSDAYLRSIQGSIRNGIALQYRYGQVSQQGLKQAIQLRVQEQCVHCSPESARSMSRRIQSILEGEIRSGRESQRDPEDARKKICASLRAENYPFDEESEYRDVFARVDRRMVGVGDPTGTTQAFIAHEVIEAFREKRRKILSKIAARGGDGLLILTDSVTELSSQNPGNIRLQCRAGSEAQDRSRITKGIAEALEKTREFNRKVSEAVRPGTAGAEELNSQLKTLLKIAPRPVGEALQFDSAMSSWVCQALGQISTEDAADQASDQVKLWGSLVVGTALSMTAIGAPAGSALLYTSLAGSLAVNVASAYSSLESSNEARELSELYRTAALAQDGNKKLLAFSVEEYQRFRENRLIAILSLGMGAADLGVMVRAGIAAGKPLAHINAELESLIRSGKQRLPATWGLRRDVNIITSESPQALKTWDPRHPLKIASDDERVNASFLALPRSEVRQLVQNGRVIEGYAFNTGNVSPTYLVKLDNGLVGIFKPKDAWKLGNLKPADVEQLKRFSSYTNELVASSVDELFGFGLVPKTVSRELLLDGKTQAGSFQLLVPKTKLIRQVPRTEKLKQAEVKLDLFDSLIDNWDRVDENFLVRGDEIIAIDHGVTFLNGENKINQDMGFLLRKAPDDVIRKNNAVESRGTLSDMARVETFLKTQSGQELEARLQSTSLERIRNHLKTTVPELSEKELISYSTRIERRRQALLQYFKKVRGQTPSQKP